MLDRRFEKLDFVDGAVYKKLFFLEKQGLVFHRFRKSCHTLYSALRKLRATCSLLSGLAYAGFCCYDGFYYATPDKIDPTKYKARNEV